MDLWIKNATIIDGTGAPRFSGDIGVMDGRIVQGGRHPSAKRVIDAKGRIVSPGFIDAHSHGDMILGTESASLFKINQGVTTEIGGQCGQSMAPVHADRLELAQKLLSIGAPSFPEDMSNWTSFGRFMEYGDRTPKTVNMLSLVGHSTLRIAVMGFENRAPSKEEQGRMKSLLREAMEAGAAGFSTGLIYTPCCYSDESEIIELVKVIVPYGGIYTSHMRNESYDIIQSVKETIEVGRRTGVTVCISHLKMMGRSNWGLSEQVLALIHEANQEGIRVLFDQYPYTSCMTRLNACVPPWYFDHGFAYLADQLKDPVFRLRLMHEMDDPETPYDNFYLSARGFDGVIVTSTARTPEAEGLSISAYAEKIGKQPFDAFFDLMAENECQCVGIFHAMSEEDVSRIVMDDSCVIGSDGLTRSWSEKGHPRTCATFPHAICTFVKEKKLMSLEKMIHKMTGLTAEYAGIRDRGIIREGLAADLVLFDIDRLQDTATYQKPNSMTEGIDLVIVNGEIVYEEGRLTGCHSGKMLRHNA